MNVIIHRYGYKKKLKLNRRQDIGRQKIREVRWDSQCKIKWDTYWMYEREEIVVSVPHLNYEGGRIKPGHNTGVHWDAVYTPALKRMRVKNDFKNGNRFRVLKLKEKNGIEIDMGGFISQVYVVPINLDEKHWVLAFEEPSRSREVRRWIKK